MKPTRPVNLLLLGIGAAVLTYLVLGSAYSSMATLPTMAGVLLLVIAVVNGGLAVALRPRFKKRRDTTPVQPLTAVRVVSLAKASSVLGALMVGFWVGFGAYVLPLRAASAAEHDVTTSVIGLVSALALVGAALWLEQTCRITESDDRDRPDDRD